MLTTSETLLARLKKPQDHEAWTRFVRLYTPLLYRWACQAGLTDADAADLTQEVFALLLEKLPAFQYEPGKSFRGWLRTLARNKMRDQWRKRVPHVLLTGPNGEFDPEDAHDPFWDEEYRQHLIARAMHVMETDFQPATWKACWEVVVAERPAADVARDLGLSVGAVYVAKFRVLERLRQELRGMLD